jgi:inosose dehydratase
MRGLIRRLVIVVLFCIVECGTAAAPVAPPGVAAQMYVWLQYNQEHGQRLEDHLDEAFAATERAGYSAVQGWLSWFATPEQTARTTTALAAHHLRLVAAYADGPLHDSGADAAIARILEQATRAREHGVLTIVMNPDVRRDGAEKTDEELAVQARNLDRLGAALQGMGLSLAVHAHDKEMRSGAREWYYNLRHTDGAKVGICLDVHWLYRGGQNPLPMLRAAGGRIRDVHLRNSLDGVWEEDLGPGDLDYGVIARALRDAKFSGTYTVELAYEPRTVRTRSIEEDLRRSRAFVRRTFGI